VSTSGAPRRGDVEAEAPALFWRSECVVNGTPAASAGWNYAEVWERIADLVPDAPALAHGETRRTWRAFSQRADGVAAALLAAGLGRQEAVAQYLYNSNEYLESVFACWKAALVPVNTNFRYVQDELAYLWDNADVAAVVFHGTFAEQIEAVRPEVPRVRVWLWVDDGSGPCPDWATPYEPAATSGVDRTIPVWGRSGDDLLLMYTGGTTGVPKGVMWRQDDLYNSHSQSIWKDPVVPDLDAVTARVTRRLGLVALPACPQMHATGLFVSMQQLCQAGCIVTVPMRRFDVEALLTTIEREHVNLVAIAGDVFARPMLQSLDAQPDRWDVSSLKVLTSAGAMWSAEVKEGLRRHLPRLVMIDMLGSSEAGGMGQSVMKGDDRTQTGRFSLNANTRVVDDDGRDVVRGSGQVGLVVSGGFQPLGYHKDEERTAATFRVIDGKRYVVPGDHATVDADGTLTFVGRGATCINTGGEKVYTEEVEEVLKRHPAVRDAVVVGVPDERFGQAVVAVVEADHVDPDDLTAFARQHLAAYKAPRRFFCVDAMGRHANGKVDHARIRAIVGNVLAP
jgi:acyl-CoA synthetase (AMP-forming)/AMP-acid ligase II